MKSSDSRSHSKRNQEAPPLQFATLSPQITHHSIPPSLPLPLFLTLLCTCFSFPQSFSTRKAPPAQGEEECNASHSKLHSGSIKVQLMLDRNSFGMTSTCGATAHTHTCTHAHIHTCTRIHTHTHTRTHTHMHTNTHAHIHTCIHTHKHTCTHTRIHTHTHKHTNTQTHTPIHIYTYTHSYRQTDRHTYTHTHVHIYLHTHICKRPSPWFRAAGMRNIPGRRRHRSCRPCGRTRRGSDGPVGKDRHANGNIQNHVAEHVGKGGAPPSPLCFYIGGGEGRMAFCTQQLLHKSRETSRPEAAY